MPSPKKKPLGEGSLRSRLAPSFEGANLCQAGRPSPRIHLHHTPLVGAVKTADQPEIVLCPPLRYLRTILAPCAPWRQTRLAVCLLPQAPTSRDRLRQGLPEVPQGTGRHRGSRLLLPGLPFRLIPPYVAYPEQGFPCPGFLSLQRPNASGMEFQSQAKQKKS